MQDTAWSIVLNPCILPSLPRLAVDCGLHSAFHTVCHCLATVIVKWRISWDFNGFTYLWIWGMKGKNVGGGAGGHMDKRKAI